MNHKEGLTSGTCRLSGQPETGLYVAPTLDDAVAALAERGREAAPLAGATWIMRAPLRQERHLFYVAIGQIAALHDVSVDDRNVSIGACATHAELIRGLAAISDCRALALGRRQRSKSGHPAGRDDRRKSVRCRFPRRRFGNRASVP